MSSDAPSKRVQEYFTETCGLSASSTDRSTESLLTDNCYDLPVKGKSEIVVTKRRLTPFTILPEEVD